MAVLVFVTVLRLSLVAVRGATPLANARDSGSIPGLRRSHMPWSN